MSNMSTRDTLPIDVPSTRTNRRRALELGIAAALLCHALPASAQAGSSRALRLLVGSPPGGLADVLARSTGLSLAQTMGRPLVVDNKPGASGTIAADTLAKSAPDGYTLFLTPDTTVVATQYIYPKLPYDPVNGLQSVALIGKATLVFLVKPSLGVKTMDEFIRLAKSKPRAINYGSGGQGHPTHLSMELLANRTGISLTHVPYKGTAPAIQGLLGGEVEAMIIGVAESMPHIKSGKLVALATSGPAAKEVFPELPLFTKLHPDLDLTVWFGIFAPAGTNEAVVAKVNGEINRFLGSAEARKQFSEFGITPTPASPRELDAVVTADRAKFGPLIKSLGITLQ
jgi:tripartite-type tricarboxylate transporter receptor subunit TctC